MTLPSSGKISLGNVNIELGRPSTTTISLGSSLVRTLFGSAAGSTIKFSQGHGRSNVSRWYGSKATWSGGYGSNKRIDYIDIQTTGNAVNAGNLQIGSQAGAGASDGNIGLITKGFPGSLMTEYISYASLGDAQNYGNLHTFTYQGEMGVSDGIKGVFAGGTGTNNSLIFYYNFASASDSYYFGSLTTFRAHGAGISNAVRGFFAGDNLGSTRPIEAITVATLGNAFLSGSLVTSKSFFSATEDSGRAIIAGGGSGSGNISSMEYMSTNSYGNSASFGNLIRTRHGGQASSDLSRAVFGGGYINNNYTLTNIEYINIQTSPGGATTSDFGNLTVGRAYAVATSGG